MNSLFKNPKFWLAVFGLIQTIVLYYVHIPTEIWAAIDGLVVVIIGSLSVDDAAKAITRFAEEMRAARLAKK
jgi:hypothetical protein